MNNKNNKRNKFNIKNSTDCYRWEYKHWTDDAWDTLELAKKKVLDFSQEFNKYEFKIKKINWYYSIFYKEKEYE